MSCDWVKNADSPLETRDKSDADSSTVFPHLICLNQNIDYRAYMIIYGECYSNKILNVSRLKQYYTWRIR